MKNIPPSTHTSLGLNFANTFNSENFGSFGSGKGFKVDYGNKLFPEMYKDCTVSTTIDYNWRTQDYEWTRAQN